jgi:hypothetical protein
MKDATLLIDYIYLDTEERKRFAQAQHEYLIEQLQFTGAESVSSKNNKYRLNFNHPSKFLAWSVHNSEFRGKKFIDWAHDGDWEAALNRAAAKIWAATTQSITSIAGDSTDLGLQEADGTISPNLSSADTLLRGKVIAFSTTQGPPDATTCQVVSHTLSVSDLTAPVSTVIPTLTVNDLFNYGSLVDGSVNPVDTARLQLNGHERFTERDGDYFNFVQPFQHFTCTPCDGLNVYSFALEPEKHQPSGTCNFSRIDNAQRVASSAEASYDIYAINYNVLRIMSGMGGLAYSN